MATRNYVGKIASTFDGRLNVEAVSGGPVGAGTSTFLSALDGGATDGGAPTADATAPLDAAPPIDGGSPPSDPGSGTDPKCSAEPGAAAAGAGGWIFVALVALARVRCSRRS